MQQEADRQPPEPSGLNEVLAELAKGRRNITASQGQIITRKYLNTLNPQGLRLFKQTSEHVV